MSCLKQAGRHGPKGGRHVVDDSSDFAGPLALGFGKQLHDGWPDPYLAGDCRHNDRRQSHPRAETNVATTEPCWQPGRGPSSARESPVGRCCLQLKRRPNDEKHYDGSGRCSIDGPADFRGGGCDASHESRSGACRLKPRPSTVTCSAKR